MERKQVQFELGVNLLKRIEQLANQQEMTLQEWMIATLAAEVTRLEHKQRSLNPQPATERKPVGRPRLSMAEKKYRDTLQQIEQNFVRLREVWGYEAAESNFGGIWKQFLIYKDAHDERHVNWLAANWSGVPGTANDPEVRQKFLQEWEQCAERKLESFS